MVRVGITKETKSGINATDAHNKRVDQSTSLRCNDREETMAQRRHRANEDAPEGSEARQLDDDQIMLDRPNIPALIQSLDSQDDDVVLNATFRLRHLLSLVLDPPFNDVIVGGGVVKLVALLNHTRHDICFEAAWCLANIASSDAKHTKHVVKCGAIPPLVELLSHDNDHVRDRAVWTLGNIAGERPRYRDLILSLGAMTKLLAIAHRVLRSCMLQNIAWTLSNFCRGHSPQPDFNIVSQALPTLHNMLNLRDDAVIAESAWSLSFLSDDTGTSNLPENHKIETVIHSGCLSRLVALLSHPSSNIKTPALRTIGNIVTGTNFQTQMVLNHNVLPALVSLLSSSRRGIRRETAWALSNIAAGTKSQVLALIEANAFHALYVAVAHADPAMKHEIVWAVYNAVSCREPKILAHIASIGWIPSLLTFLDDNNTDLQICALDALHHFLEWGEQNKVTQEQDGQIREINVYGEIIKSVGGVDILETLLSRILILKV